MIIPDQAVWLVPLAFYLLDNCILLRQDEFLLYQTGSSEWRTKLDPVPFTWRSKAVYLLNPLTPFSCAVKLPWSPTSDFSGLNSRLKALRVLSEFINPVRIVATASFISLFIVGPALTALTGIGNALVSVMPIHFSLAVSTFFFSRRRVRPTQRALRVLEFIVCPGYLPNVCRRSSMLFSPGRKSWAPLVDQLVPAEDATEFSGAMKTIMSEQFEGDAA